MKLNKKISFIALGAAVLSLTAVAADNLAELNIIAAEILAPFQTEKSSATLEFTELTTDDANVLTLKTNASYSRVGRAQSLLVKVDELSHSFDGGRPVSKLSGSAQFDLTKLFPVDQSDALVEGAEEMVKDIAKNYTKEYGEAVTVEARVYDQVKNDEGHYTGFKATLSATIDLAKLPEGKKPEDMAILGGKIDLAITLATGIALNAEIEHNPSFHGFKAGDAANFKVAIDKLLTRDEAAKGQILNLLTKVDEMAGQIVDAQTK